MRLVFACLISLSAVPGIAMPQSAAQIRLTTPDGDLSITGTFLGLEGEAYRLETAAGIFTIPMADVTCEGPACPALSEVLVYANAKLGQPITLKGNNLMISGTLRAFENQIYVIETKIGEMRVPASGILCKGAGCPFGIEVPASHLPRASIAKPRS